MIKIPKILTKKIGCCDDFILRNWVLVTRKSWLIKFGRQNLAEQPPSRREMALIVSCFELNSEHLSNFFVFRVSDTFFSFVKERKEPSVKLR